jgi:uncharacterized YccA/Bax inhibitor family protein
MLRSSNPILSKKDAFTPAAPQYGQNPYQTPYGSDFGPSATQTSNDRMTFDDVVTKTAVTMGVLVLTAAAAWNLVPPSLYLPGLILSGIVGFIVVLLVSFRRSINPGLVLFYAAVEGVFIGMISKIFEMNYGGIVAQAVIATFFAAGATLAAYKFFNIRVTAKFTKVVIISTIAFAVLMLANFVFSLATGSTGLRGGITGPVSGFSVLISAIAIVLAVFNLILDFDYIEKGVASGAPAKESWRGAFGLTVTMVWLYIEMLRLLSYIRR